MLRRFLLGLAVVAVCSTNAQAQDDFFLAFGDGTPTATLSDTATADVTAGTGSVFLYSTLNVDYQSIGVEIESSNRSVASVTSATIFNPSLQLSPFGAPANRFTNPDESVDADGNRLVQPGDDIEAFFNVAEDSLSLVGVGSFNGDAGVIGGAGPAGLDETFNAGANAFLIAEINYDLLGGGSTEFSIIEEITDEGQVISFLVSTSPEDVFIENAVLGTATLNVTSAAVPEPSSAILLALGFAGFAARRRR